MKFQETRGKPALSIPRASSFFLSDNAKYFRRRKSFVELQSHSPVPFLRLLFSLDDFFRYFSNFSKNQQRFHPSSRFNPSNPSCDEKASRSIELAFILLVARNRIATFGSRRVSEWIHVEQDARAILIAELVARADSGKRLNGVAGIFACGQPTICANCACGYAVVVWANVGIIGANHARFAVRPFIAKLLARRLSNVRTRWGCSGVDFNESIARERS